MRWILSAMENSSNPPNRLSNPEANATCRLIPYTAQDLLVHTILELFKYWWMEHVIRKRLVQLDRCSFLWLNSSLITLWIAYPSHIAGIWFIYKGDILNKESDSEPKCYCSSGKQECSLVGCWWVVEKYQLCSSSFLVRSNPSLRQGRLWRIVISLHVWSPSSGRNCGVLTSWEKSTCKMEKITLAEGAFQELQQSKSCRIGCRIEQLEKLNILWLLLD